jgi:hypothetical protein
VLGQFPVTALIGRWAFQAVPQDNKNKNHRSQNYRLQDDKSRLEKKSVDP